MCYGTFRLHLYRKPRFNSLCSSNFFGKEKVYNMGWNGATLQRSITFMLLFRMTESTFGMKGATLFKAFHGVVRNLNSHEQTF